MKGRNGIFCFTFLGKRNEGRKCEPLSCILGSDKEESGSPHRWSARSFPLTFMINNGLIVERGWPPTYARKTGARSTCMIMRIQTFLFPPSFQSTPQCPNKKTRSRKSSWPWKRCCWQQMVTHCPEMSGPPLPRRPFTQKLNQTGIIPPSQLEHIFI